MLCKQDFQNVNKIAESKLNQNAQYQLDSIIFKTAAPYKDQF